VAIKIGTRGADTLTGTTAFDLLLGGLGNDTIATAGGQDIVLAGLGDDLIQVASGTAVVNGGGGSDTVSLEAGDWFIALPQLDGTTKVFNTETGEIVTLTDVEFLKIGSETIAFKAGTDSADTLTGTATNDFIRGLDGNDLITSGAGNDWVSGGAGSDTVETGAGNDTIDERNVVTGGESGSDTVGNTVDAGEGNDIILLGLSAHETLGSIERYDIDGGEGTDVVYLRGWKPNLLASVGDGEDGAQILINVGNDTTAFAELSRVEQVVDVANDIVWTADAAGVFTEGRPELNATAAQLQGTALSEDLVGNDDDNVLIGGGGFDRFTGGDGTDTAVLSGRVLDYSIAGPRDAIKSGGSFDGMKLLNLGDPHSPAAFIAADIEKLTFTYGDRVEDDVTFSLHFITTDSFAGATSEMKDFIVVDAGVTFSATTTLSTLGGYDVISGQGDLKLIDSGAHRDFINWEFGSGGAAVKGGGGSDRIIISGKSTATGTITLDGGTGDDAIFFRSPKLFATITGGEGDDAIHAGVNANVDGSVGNDRIFIEFDQIAREESTITGGDGEDVLFLSGNSTDFLISKTAEGDIEVVSKLVGTTLIVDSVEALQFDDGTLLATAIGTDATFAGDEDNDTLAGTASTDLANGGAGDDTLSGAAANDILAGDGGADQLNGDEGDDTLAGGAGGDTLRGGSGDDYLVGGAGNDQLEGGDGADSFVFRSDLGAIGDDTVTDFDAGGEDVLVFSRSVPGLNSFEELLAAATETGGNTTIAIDDDNSITLTGVTKADLEADQFLFL